MRKRARGAFEAAPRTRSSPITSRRHPVYLYLTIEQRGPIPAELREDVGELTMDALYAGRVPLERPVSLKTFGNLHWNRDPMLRPPTRGSCSASPTTNSQERFRPLRDQAGPSDGASPQRRGVANRTTGGDPDDIRALRAGRDGRCGPARAGTRHGHSARIAGAHAQRSPNQIREILELARAAKRTRHFC